MAFRERAASPAIPQAGISGPNIAAAILRAFAPVQPLLAPFAAAWLIYVALGVLLQSRALRVYSAGLLPSVDFLRNVALALTPDSLLTASRYSARGTIVLILYGVLVCLAIASWCWAYRVARRLDLTSVTPLLAITALLATPLLATAGLVSDDVYLYGLYGRTIDAYGANPILSAPALFPYDEHLKWVHWRELPASYGPVWLTLSGVLSGIAGDSITAVVMTYRTAALALHLLTAAGVWFVLRRARPETAMAGTIFYAWNPLVLMEVVANAHNDVLVACFAVLMVAAAAHRAWSSAAFFAACAVMVKPFAALLVPPLALRIIQSSRGRTRARLILTSGAVGVGSLILLSVPLWAGARLLSNITSNPASYIYTNTIWELISETGPAWFHVRTVRIQHPYLDVVREALFIVGACWVLTRRSSRRGVAPTALRLWLLFCLTACWVWPWYFVPAIALAALTGSRGIAPAAALTLGGLLFWTTWPPPAPNASTWLHTWRSLVLFGPLLLTLAFSPVRAAALAALGVKRRPIEPDDDPVVDALQTSPG